MPELRALLAQATGAPSQAPQSSPSGSMVAGLGSLGPFPTPQP